MLPLHNQEWRTALGMITTADIATQKMHQSSGTGEASHQYSKTVHQLIQASPFRHAHDDAAHISASNAHMPFYSGQSATAIDYTGKQ